MTMLDTRERTTEELIDEVRQHPSYRPEINSESEAHLALNGLPPFTYMVRKGRDRLCYYVSFVTDEHAIISEEFRIIEEKRQYQYYNFWKSPEEAPVDDDPYYLKFFSDLEDIIFLAAMKCDKNRTQTLV
jgi:hypothetical protein